MKKTTKILIGTFAGILLLIMGFMAYLTRYTTDFDAYSPSMADANLVARPLPAGIEHFRWEFDSDFYSYAAQPAVQLFFSDSVQDGGTLHLPRELEPYVETKQIGNTLVFRLLRPEKLSEEHGGLRIAPFPLELIVPNGSLHEISGTEGINLQMNRYETSDTLHVFLPDSHLQLADSCTIGKLIVQEVWSLDMSRCRIDTLSIRGNGPHNWNIQNSPMQHVEIYSDGRQAVNQELVSGCTFDWHPLSEDANLKISNLGTPLHIAPIKPEAE